MINPATTDWIETYTGKKFYPLESHLSELDIHDIAHALSNICRFAGHTRYFYSVAQHCVMIAEELRRDGYVPLVQLTGLMHDAPEAYMVDLPSPIKKALPDYRHAEEKLMERVSKQFFLLTDHDTNKIIHHYDMRALATETRDLMNNTDNWISKFNVAPFQKNIRTMYPDVAKVAFMSTFEKLMKEVLDELNR